METDRHTESGKQHGTAARPPAPPHPATVDVTADGDRVRMSVRGDLDFGAQRIRYEIQEALRRSAKGIDLDLSAVAFCDCSGLNLLLDARKRALSQGKTLAICANSPAVERLLGLIGAHELFACSPANASVTETTGNRGRRPQDEERVPHREAVPPRQAVRSRRKTPVAESSAGRPVAATPERVPAGSR